jgi:hypothetical protein
MHIALWIVQVLLALFFALGSGLPKFFLSPEQLNMPILLPDLFVRTIGVFEVLGALGLILPGVTRRQLGLTPLAAACLALLTVCATVYQVLAHQPESAVFATVLGLICAAVAYTRWRLIPLRTSAARRSTLPLASVALEG